MGAARSDLDRLAAQSRRLAGQIRPIPWVYGEIVRQLSASSRSGSWSRTRAEKRERATCWSARRRQPRPGGVPSMARPTASGPAITARSFVSTMRKPRTPRSRMEVQRLGQVRQLAAATTRCRSQWRTAANCRVEARDQVWRTADGRSSARRRQHRRQRRGELLTTEECLLSDIQGAIPGSAARNGAVFARLPGRRPACIWLNRGIAGDDTHGHVDDLARFVEPKRSSPSTDRIASDENYEPLAGEPRTASGRRALVTANLSHSWSCRCPALFFRGPAPAGELRQFLHRQRPGPGPDVQRPPRST